MSRPAFVEELLRPEAYPVDPPPEEVELRETHISWIFFAGSRVYKVCKPVDFGFLDFTTLEQRRRDTWAEVRLNRRLSPDVYLGVSEIRSSESGAFLTSPRSEPDASVPPHGADEGDDGGGGDGRAAAGGERAPIDYAVVMRRLPDDRWLSELFEDGGVEPRQVRRIARRIADFHARAETGPEITRIGDHATVTRNVRENFEQTERYVGKTLTDDDFRVVRAYSEAFLDVREPLFRARESEGRIRDGHGDLHAEHVSVHDGIEFIDCIEFNERFRYADVAADLAFLAMDLERHGRPDLGRVLVDEYVERSGDAGLGEILRFYECYRAYTRGKVTSFRIDDDLDSEARRACREEAREYFRLARSYATLDPPILLITCGLMGAGKTTLARNLAPLLDADVLSSDIVRKELAGIDAGEARPEAWGEGIYSAEHTERTYEELHARAAEGLSRGRSMIVDASYARAERRRDAAETARNASAPEADEPGELCLVLHVTCEEEELRRRLARRSSEGPGGRSPEMPVSDGRLELLERQIEAFEPPREASPGKLVVVDATDGVSETADAALAGIYRRMLAASRDRCSSSAASTSSPDERSSKSKASE